MKELSNLAASVRQRLLNRARARGEEFNFTLSRYAIERLLVRLAASRYRERFVLKGATLFVLWSGEPHRATWDLDLLGRGGESISEMEEVFREICGTPVSDDGVAFDAESVKGEEIREETEYGGIRIRMRATLGAAEIGVQVDVGFGDAIVPAPETRAYPAALGGEPIPVLAYPRETTLAEKLEAMVALGIRNGRMKDFYDLHFLAGHFGFSGTVVRDAIQHTFRRRGTPFPEGVPVGLTEEFVTVPDRAAQWRAFVRRGRLTSSILTLSDLLGLLRDFLLPPLAAARATEDFDRVWAPRGPWR